MGFEGVLMDLMDLLREAWGALALALALIALLGMLAHLLRVAGGMAMGGARGVAAGLAGGIGIFAIVLFGFLAVPEIARAARAAMAAPACGPMADLAGAAAMLIGAIGALRMLQAVAEATVGAALGGPASLARAMWAAAETVFGMAMTAMVLPLIFRFLGGC